MTGEMHFPLEEFLEAITSQLDKTQDALRLKAVNRPLTFALKDFDLDLKVFVDMDAQGQIRFRPSGPNETGASTVTIGFTTITRPMIEENTVSMEMTASPTLDEIGLEPAEQKRLERLGVRNAAQLRQLEAHAGDNNLSRLSGVNVDKLRQALQMGRPQLDGLRAVPERPARRPQQAPSPEPNQPRPALDPARISARAIAPEPAAPARHPAPEKLRITPDVRRVQLRGRNLVDRGEAPRVELDGRRLKLLRAREHEIDVELPPNLRGGLLSVTLPDASVQSFELDVGLDVDADGDSNGTLSASDPWLPEGGARQ